MCAVPCAGEEVEEGGEGRSNSLVAEEVYHGLTDSNTVVRKVLQTSVTVSPPPPL